jgi:DNA-binding NarL/FixJ family response regulator
MSGVLRDIVRDALVGKPDIEVIADVTDGGAAAAAEALQPTTLVWGSDVPISAEALHDVLYRHPRVRVLTVERDGRKGHLHELVPHTAVLGELSPQRLLAAIRGQSIDGQ